MSDLSPLSGEQRKSNFGAVSSVDDPKPDHSKNGTLEEVRSTFSPQKSGK